MGCDVITSTKEREITAGREREGEKSMSVARRGVLWYSGWLCGGAS